MKISVTDAFSELEEKIMKKNQAITYIIFAICLFFISQDVLAQAPWKYFTTDDFSQRRQKLMEKIPDGHAIFVSAEMPDAYVKFRQDNTFYYLTGVEIPGALLWLNGKTKKSTLFIPDEIPEDIKKESWIAATEKDARRFKFDKIETKKWLLFRFSRVQYDNEVIYLNMAPQETASMSRDQILFNRFKRIKDPLHKQISKEIALAQQIREQVPLVIIKNIANIIDEMRWIKDDKEIAVLKECGRIGALGFNEAIKITRPGIFEYQVSAACEFYYQYNGAQNPAFLPIAASGERALVWHYNANNHQLTDGDVILLDYAPDLHYYVTDIGRTWPVSGKFSDEQLRYYKCIKDAHQEIINAIKPGVMIADLKAVGKEVFENHDLGAHWLNYVGHFVGMSVHDPGPYDRPFEKGVVFNVEPIIEDKEKKFHMRLEDTIIVTDDGAENITNLTPLEPEEIYKLMAEKGLWEGQ